MRRDISKVKKFILYNRFFNWDNNCILHGILCMPITIASVIPNVSVDIKDEPIASPSGKLCSNIISKVKKFILYNRFFNWDNNCILHLKMI